MFLFYMDKTVENVTENILSTLSYLLLDMAWPMAIIRIILEKEIKILIMKMRKWNKN